MVYDFYYFLNLFEGSSRRLDPSQIKRRLTPVKWGEKTKCWPENQVSSSSYLHLQWTFLQI